VSHLIGGVRHAVASQSWHAALGLALALPDICGRLQAPSTRSTEARYAAWFKTFIEPSYFHRVAGVTMLTASDCYALRCAYLHEGDIDITGQSARHSLDRFAFVAPRAGSIRHRNRMNNMMQLQVDLFCEEICAGVEAWLATVASDAAIQGRIALLPTIVLGGP
jgi:hypothetical protein